MLREPNNARRGVTDFFLYSLAVVVACFLSFATVLVLAISGLPRWGCWAVTGFVGVFVPSFFVRSASRWFCALFLLVVGAGFYYFRFIRQVRGEDPEASMLQPASSLVPLIAGGTAAVVVHYYVRRLNKRLPVDAGAAPRSDSGSLVPGTTEADR